MKNIDHAKMLHLMAQKDHHALLVMLDPNTVALEIFGLHVQQAVEKTIKAWLCLIGVPYPKKHDLDQLADLLAKAGATIPTQFTSLLEFTDFAVVFRYEAFPDFNVAIDREDTTALVGQFLHHVDILLANKQEELIKIKQ
ncbi:MAG: HEPN domain-containing protein [Magnetococcus sp. YQC-5]